MSQTFQPQGVIVPTVSPFTPAGLIDTPAMKKIVDHLITNGAAGIFPLGTTGEAASIAMDERLKLVEATVKATTGRAVVYAGISSNSFKESVDASVAYREAGAQAVVAHAPSYYTLSDAQIENYFVRLADRVALPLVLYNIPQTTKLTIPVESVVRLSKHKNIIAIKDSANDPVRLTELLKATGGRGGFPVILGNSLHFTHGLKAGGVGLVPSGAHVVKDEYTRMCTTAAAGKWDEVERLQAETDRVCKTYTENRSLAESLATLKYFLEQRGLCGRTMLPPLTDVEAR